MDKTEEEEDLGREVHDCESVFGKLCSDSTIMIERLSAEHIQEKEGLRKNHSTSARVRRKVP